MDTCVRNGVYDEALDLAAFINRLGVLHAELPVARLLRRQAAEVSAAMLEQLLQRLRGGIQVGGGMARAFIAGASALLQTGLNASSEFMHAQMHTRPTATVRPANHPTPAAARMPARHRLPAAHGGVQRGRAAAAVSEVPGDVVRVAGPAGRAVFSLFTGSVVVLCMPSGGTIHLPTPPTNRLPINANPLQPPTANQPPPQRFSGLVADLDDGDSHEFVKALTDLHRLHMFDVLMQYRAIFFDAAQVSRYSLVMCGPFWRRVVSWGCGGRLAVLQRGLNQPKPTDHQSHQDDKQSAAPATRDSAALYSWVQHRVGAYCRLLRRHLPGVTEGGALASVLEHCSYCGASLSRVGMDFRVGLGLVFWITFAARRLLSQTVCVLA